MTASQQLRERLNPAWPEKIRAISNRALSAFDSFAASRDVIDTNKADWIPAMRTAATPAGKTIAGAVRDLDRARAKQAESRAALLAKATAHATPRDADLATEIRAHIRTLSQGEVTALLIGDGADPAAQRAAMEGPTFLTGISPEVRARVTADYLGLHHADDVAALAMADDALAHAETSIKATRNQIERDARFETVVAFERWLEMDCQPDPAADDADAARAKVEAERLAAVDARLSQLVA